MILETVRMVADALAHSGYGVNVQLATLSLDGGDPVPSPIAVIADETRSPDVAVGRYPTTTPCLTVTLEGNVSLDGEVISDNRDADVTILIRYVTRDVDAASGNADVLYTLRAVQKTIRAFNSNTNAIDRVRNAIQILECLSMEHASLFDSIDDVVCTGGVRVTFKVRDTNP